MYISSAKDYWDINLNTNTAKTLQTPVPDRFIDEIMVGANGEYVKVFLYLLRHAGENVSADDIADALELTGADVRRALVFLDKNGAFDDIPTDRKSASPAADTAAERKINTAALSDDDEFKALLFELQSYLGKTFNKTEADIVGYMYDNMKMPADLIEYLFEICRQKGKTSLRYIEKVAQNWHSAGITSVEEAKKDTSFFSDEIDAVKKSLGIKSRDLAEKEMEFIIRWIREYKMSAELVKEACSRTVMSTGKASFSYADSILKAWKDKNVTNIDQLKVLDDEHKSSAAAEARSAAAGRSAARTANNSFHNFNQREESLDKEVLDKFNDLFK